MPVTFPGESSGYRVARDILLAEEIDLRRRIEAVAAARRALPHGGVVPEDYVFDGAGPGGSLTRVPLSALFSPGRDTLVVYHMMFPRDPGDRRGGAATGETARLPLDAAPCPSCTALLDQLDGAVEHVAPHFDFVVVAKAPIDRVLTFANERGWRRLRFVSCAVAAGWPGATSETVSAALVPVSLRASPTPARRSGPSVRSAAGPPATKHVTRTTRRHTSNTRVAVSASGRTVPWATSLRIFQPRAGSVNVNMTRSQCRGAAAWTGRRREARRERGSSVSDEAHSVRSACRDGRDPPR